MDRQEMRLRCLEAAARLNRVYSSDNMVVEAAAAFAAWVGPSDSDACKTPSPPVQPVRPTLGVSNKK